MSHILILPSWYPTDRKDTRGIFFREQALALCHSGHKVGVISPDLRSLKKWKSLFSRKFGFEVDDDDRVLTIRYHGLKIFGKLPYASLQMERYLWNKLFDKYISQHGLPDIIHVHSLLNAGLQAMSIQRRHGIPYVVTEHSSAYSKNLLGPAQIQRAKSIAKAANKRLAVSRSLATLLEQILGTDAGEWIDIPNMVSQRFVDYPLPVPKDNQKEFTFLFIGLLAKKKAVDTLIHGFAKAFADTPTVRLKIGGDGAERPRLKAEAERLGVANQIDFLGHLSREEVIVNMAAADAFVLPSIYETFGVVLIEALALGKPVIATKCGGPESIVTSLNGILVPSGNAESFAKAMTTLRSEFDRYEPATLRADCIERFSQTSVVRRLEAVYTEIIQEQIKGANGKSGD